MFGAVDPEKLSVADLDPGDILHVFSFIFRLPALPFLPHIEAIGNFLTQSHIF